MRILAALLVFVTLGFVMPRKKKITLKELVDNPAYEVTIKSNGKYSGESVELKVKSEKAKKIEIVIPAGTLFYPENEDEQTLVLPQQRVLAMERTRGSFVLDGFCTEANDGAPSRDGAFVVADSQNEKLNKLITFFKDCKVDKHNIQEAVWCVTDGESINNITLKNKEDDKKLMNLLTELTGQEVSWYRKRRNISMNSATREINRETVNVLGEVTFSTSKKSIIKSKIVDTLGELVYDNKKDFTIPKAIKNISLDFKLNVRGWEKGTYYVVYYIEEGNEEVLKQSFEI